MQSTKLAISLITVLTLFTATACGTKTTPALAPPGNSPGTGVSSTQNPGNTSVSANSTGSLSTNVGAKGVNKKVSPQQKQQAQNTVDEIANAVNQLH